MDAPTSTAPLAEPAAAASASQTPDWPAPPPMRIVTKGWWWRPDEFATADELEQADKARR
jgi:hypothetical protein